MIFQSIRKKKCFVYGGALKFSVDKLRKLFFSYVEFFTGAVTILFPSGNFLTVD